MKMLAPYLPATLQWLDLDYSNIGDLGAQALAPHLPATLKRLELSDNNIGDVGVRALALHFPATLQSLNLMDNKIGDEGLAALLEAIPRTDLETLFIFIPSTSPRYQQFKNLRNRQGNRVVARF